MKRAASDFIKKVSSFSVTTYKRPDIVFKTGKGSILYDVNDKPYIDFTSGIAVTALGHSNKQVSEIINEQASTLMHSSNLYNNVYTGELCETLVTKTKEKGGMRNASRVFLCNSGTEANEAALKFSRKYGKAINPNKTKFITFKNSFHGRSMGALSLTPNPKYQKPFEPLVPGVKVAIPNDIESVRSLMDEEVCGVIIEPIQGEGGIYPMTPSFLKQLRELCTANKALLIFDEIQCGLGRTGKLWAHCNQESHPDILTMAKALGNGFPIGATMITEDVEAKINVGDHGTTYGGNPLGSRIGTFMVNTISEDKFLGNVKEISNIFFEKLNEIKSKYPTKIKDVRGEGLLIGVEMEIECGKIIDAAREKGLLIISAGNNTIRIIPALNTDKKVIENGLAVLEEVIRITN